MHDHTKHDVATRYTFRDYLPLIAVLISIVVLTGLHVFLFGRQHDPMYVMRDFMGARFFVFAMMKIRDIGGFAKAYSTYDVIAQKIPQYGFVYPFIEFGLGLAYLANHTMQYSTLILWITVVVMTVSARGVIKALLRKSKFQCACLGVGFKIPLTYVSLGEDVFMLVMAIGMLIYNFV